MKDLKATDAWKVQASWVKEAERLPSKKKKALGAGGGGFMLYLSPHNKKKLIINSLKNLTHVPINFEPEGSKIIYTD